MADKQNEPIIYIRNHDDYQKVCKYSLLDGTYKEITRSELLFGLKKGFYVYVKGIFVGLFSHFEGPVFFINEKQFILKKSRFSFKISQYNELENKFTFILNDANECTITYPKILQKEYDAWSDEEMVDFFKWLYVNQNDDKFFSYYTEN